MTKRRRFTTEFRRQVVEEFLSDTYTKAQILRRYEMAYGTLADWIQKYDRGQLDNEPSAQGALEVKVEQLQRLVADQALQIELLKKLQKVVAKRNEKLSVPPEKQLSQKGVK